jgi:hypothetical protein
MNVLQIHYTVSVAVDQYKAYFIHHNSHVSKECYLSRAYYMWLVTDQIVTKTLMAESDLISFQNIFSYKSCNYSNMQGFWDLALESLTLKTKAIWSLETSGITCPTTLPHIQEDLDLHQNYCEKSDLITNE